MDTRVRGYDDEKIWKYDDKKKVVMPKLVRHDGDGTARTNLTTDTETSSVSVAVNYDKFI